MPATNYAMKAYRTASSYKAQRDVEADVFYLVTNALRTTRDTGIVHQVQAVADNRRLWTTVQTVISDPENALPLDLRASILSLGIKVQREMNNEHPDIDFLISINETMANGLANQ